MTSQSITIICGLITILQFKYFCNAMEQLLFHKKLFYDHKNSHKNGEQLKTLNFQIYSKQSCSLFVIYQILSQIYSLIILIRTH